jgi:hypothetical protein
MSTVPYFADLPEEICLHILRLLELNELLTMARTNRRFHRLAQDDLLWQRLFLDASYQCSPRDEEEGIPYKVLFKQEHRTGRQKFSGTYGMSLMRSRLRLAWFQ